MIERRRPRRRIEQPSPSSADSKQMMTLSLFIMLLAFFIVLNAISTYEEFKTEQVRRSVEIAFTKKTEIKETAPSIKDDPAKSLKEGHAFDRLKALFEAQISSFEQTQSKSRGVMMVRVPYDKFFEAVKAAEQKDLTVYPTRRSIRGNFFLPTLTSILRSEQDGTATRMEIFLLTNDNPAEIQNQSPAIISKKIIQAGALTRKLEEIGLPRKLMNVGISKGDPDYVDLVFRKYIPFTLQTNTIPEE